MKQVLLLFILSFLIAFSISNTCIKVSAQNLPVHNIDTGIDYATIQEAIDASNTTNGHTILVDDGTYYEHVTLHKAVKLLGANQSKAIIDGNGTGQVVSLMANDAEIAGFTLQNGEWGVDLYGVQNATVTKNKLFQCSYGGIKVHECSICRIINNTAISNTEAGIYLFESIGNLITNNTVANSSHGIWILAQSTNNIINRNFFMDNPQGIVLSFNCNNNTVTGNTVTSSNWGIATEGAHNNTIFHNNLLQNTQQVYSYGDSSNFWDDDAEGNFWKDYTGPDTNNDGIGETPYTIKGENPDNHPLMGMFNDFIVTWEEESHRVYVISNSTVSDFNFEVTYTPDIRKAIVFNVIGEDGAVGFCRVMIPTALVNYSYTVLVDGKEVDTTVLDISNNTHAYIYFTYTTSTKQVLIVPEYASSLMLPLLLISTIFAVVFSKKKRRQVSGEHISETSLSPRET